MSDEVKWHEWAMLMQQERPWIQNNVTSELLLEVRDQDLAYAIWALMGNQSLEWLKKPIPNLNNRSIQTVLQVSGGKKLIWETLESMSAWM